MKKYPEILGLVVSLILVYIAGHAVQSNWSYFTMYEFGWTERMVGISLGVMGAVTGIVQGGIIRWSAPRLGDHRSVNLGLCFYALGMLLFAFANQSWMMYAFLVPYCLGGIAGPSLQSIITKNIPSQEQGALQGALTSLMSGTAIIGPPLMTNLFYYFTHDDAPFLFPGAPFFLSFILFILSIILINRNFRKKKA